MSRKQPFPTNGSRRANPPPVAYDGRYETNTTMPLSINRQPARPMTPSSSTSSALAHVNPARPARSDLRPTSRHASQYSVSSVSSRNVDYDGASTMSYETAGPSRTQENNDGIDAPETSTTSLKAVLNAFQKAGAQRKRAMTNGTLDREKERERELQEEMQRQKRIRDKVPGRRANGKAKAVGNIDGERSACFPVNTAYLSCSCAGSYRGRLGLCY